LREREADGEREAQADSMECGARRGALSKDPEIMT